jgi:pimeloyl-ACP methyl ester carboxylesterase
MITRIASLIFTVFFMLLGTVVAMAAEWSADGFVGERGGNSLVVFVHGIGGSRTETWGEPGTAWPDILKKDTEFFSGFDVYVYDYPSSIFGKSQPAEVLGRLLRDKLNGINISQYENVIFITHSLGGIVVREYLLDNLETSTNVVGVFAFAAPMDGSYLANIASHFSQSDTIVELRNESSANAYVGKLVDRWIGKKPAITIRNWCGYETEPLFGYFGKYFSKFVSLQVVSPGSAKLLCQEDAFPISGDHWSIVKPGGSGELAHSRVQQWTVDAMAKAQPAVVEQEGDIVFANCGDSPYGLATQSEMFRIADEVAPGKRIRLSRRLPVDYSASVRSLLWGEAKPSMIIIHLSCFQNGPETQANAVLRTQAFVNLLDRIKRDKVKVLVYSRAFIKQPNFRKQTYFPQYLDQYYGTRAAFVPYNSNILMAENPEGQAAFKEALQTLLKDDTVWPQL